ncbi:MAG: SRPBCC family protein [Sandaracinaceae bacterium]|nr:SRPBCC family protein [Sandaracinaceae bacterium]
MRVETYVDIASPPSIVTGLMLDFGGLARWLPGVEGVQADGVGPGSIRRYRFATSTFEERLEASSPDERTLRYTVLAGPLPVGPIDASYVVQEHAGGSRVRWAAELSASEGLEEAMSSALLAMQDAVLGLLKVTLEESLPGLTGH